MSSAWTRATGLAVAWAATALWLVNLVAWQPGTERVESAENNTYWARDLRWATITAAVVGVVWAVRGARRRSALAAAGGVGWLVVDALLDRLDVGTAFGWAAGTVTLLAAVAAGRHRSVPDPARAAPTPGRGSLLVAACVAASLAPAAAATESPTDTETALTAGSVASAVLLVVAAFGAALAASSGTDVVAAPGARRRRAVAAVLLAVAAIGLVVAVRVVGPTHAMLPAWLLGVEALTGVWVVGRVRPMAGAAARGVALAALAFTLALPALETVAFLMLGYTTPIAAAFTALAGNPPVNSSDTDAVLSVPAAVAGLVIGVAVAARELRWRLDNHDDPAERWPALVARDGGDPGP
jgi:hypothetical protein